MLEDEGLLVDILLDAREALDRADRVSYALAICDMSIPYKDPEKLTAKFRRFRSETAPTRAETS